MAPRKLQQRVDIGAEAAHAVGVPHRHCGGAPLAARRTVSASAGGLGEEGSELRVYSTEGLRDEGAPAHGRHAGSGKVERLLQDNKNLMTAQPRLPWSS